LGGFSYGVCWFVVVGVGGLGVVSDFSESCSDGVDDEV
jgi:hypothetical protein